MRSEEVVCERNRAIEHAQMGAGLVRKATLNLAPPFHSLIMRLMHPATYVTIVARDLLSKRPDGEIEPVKKRGKRDRLKAPNQHACVIGPGFGRAVSSQSVYI